MVDNPDFLKVKKPAVHKVGEHSDEPTHTGGIHGATFRATHNASLENVGDEAKFLTNVNVRS